MPQAEASEAANHRRPIVFVNLHYAPDVASTGQHLTDLAEHLASEGLPVGVVTSRTRYQAGKVKAPARELLNRVEVWRVWATGFGRGSTAGRLLDYASFLVTAIWRLLWVPRPSVLVSLTTPPLLHTAVAAAARLRRCRFVVWSMDLHPEVEEAAGMIRPGGWVSGVLRGVAGAGYRAADRVVDLGPVMARRLQKHGVGADRQATIPVWSRADEIYPISRRDNPIAADLALGRKFVVMYSGNAGIAHRFGEVCGAMDEFRADPTLLFLFVGGGPRRPEIESYAEGRGLANLLYLDYFPREELARSLSLGDVHLLTLDASMAGVVVPGKLFGIMAAARPVLMIGPRESEPAMIIEEHKCGWVLDPANVEDPTRALVDLIKEIRETPAECAARGERGREAFLEHFQAASVLPSWARSLSSVASLDQ